MTEDRDIDVPHETSSFVEELRRLADALESGEAFTVHIEGEDVTIPEGAQLSIAHEREGDEVELEFQVTWTMADTEGDDEIVSVAQDEIDSASADAKAAEAERTEATSA